MAEQALRFEKLLKTIKTGYPPIKPPPAPTTIYIGNILAPTTIRMDDDNDDCDIINLEITSPAIAIKNNTPDDNASAMTINNDDEDNDENADDEHISGLVDTTIAPPTIMFENMKLSPTPTTDIVTTEYNIQQQ